MVAEPWIADQAEHYDEMAEYTQRVGAQPVELSVERRNPRSVADKNAVGSRRAARRVVTSVEQKEKTKGREKQADDARECTFALDDYDELIPEWLNFIKGFKDSEEIPLDICRETLLQNKIMRVTKKNQVKKCLEMLAEIAEQKDDCKMFYKQIGRRLKLGIHEGSTVGVKTAELLMFNTSKSGGEEISLKEYAERIEEEQNDICYTNDESITVVSSLLEENLRKKGHEVLYMVDPLDEYAVHQFKEFGGKMLKSTTKEGLDLGDEEEKNKIEELKAEFKPLTKLIKEVLGDNGECVPSTSEYGWSAEMKCIVEAQGRRDNSMTSYMVSSSSFLENLRKYGYEVPYMADPGDDAETALAEQRMEMAARGQVDGQRVRQHTGAAAQHRSTQQHNNDHRKQWQQPRKKEGEEKGQGGRKEEEEREAEGGGGEQVNKDVTDWVEVRRRTRRKRCEMVQIFVKVNGSKATPIEVNLTDDRVEDVMRRIQDDENVYVTLHGRVLKRGEKLKSCGVTDGCTIQVTSRLRGGGKHKDRKGKVEKKGSEKEADGLCAMACEQMRWMTESVNMLQSTDEDKRRLAEEVEKMRKLMAGMRKQATGGDLQRVAEMEENLKKLEEKVQMKEVTREDRGCAGLVQGGDETHEMNETSRKGRGKGNGGKGEHGGKGGVRSKGGVQVENLVTDEDQENERTMRDEREEEEHCWDVKRKVVRMMKSEEEQKAGMMKSEEEQKADEEERGRVAPNMGAGGSHPQAMSDPGNGEEEKREARVLSWADCKDEEVEENQEGAEGEKETRQEEELTGEKPPGLEEEEVESEPKTQQEEKPSRVERELKVEEEEQKKAQEAREDEEKRAQEARELRRAQEAREEERKAQEAREDEEKRAQEAREEQRRAQEARKEQERAQEAREEQRKAQEAREEERRAQEAREQKRVQEAQEREAKAQEERKKEVRAQEERERLVREAKVQEEREREREKLRPRGGARVT